MALEFPQNYMWHSIHKGKQQLSANYMIAAWCNSVAKGYLPSWMLRQAADPSELPKQLIGIQQRNGTISFATLALELHLS